FICYTIYTGLDWFNIHTAMVTCYFVALSSVGETVHKLTLRIVGCLIGAGLGVFAIVVLMPVMTDIGQLALMVGAVAFVAAWIAAGSPRISYTGWQIAFFLSTLPSFLPASRRDARRLTCPTRASWFRTGELRGRPLMLHVVPAFSRIGDEKA